MVRRLKKIKNTQIKESSKVRFFGELMTEKEIIQYAKEKRYHVKNINDVYYRELIVHLDNFLRYWGDHLEIPSEELTNISLLKFGSGCNGFWALYRPEKGEWEFQAAISFLPVPIIEYIVLHELCHYHHGGHGEEFHGLIKKHMPDYLERKKELEEIDEIFLRWISQETEGIPIQDEITEDFDLEI